MNGMGVIIRPKNVFWGLLHDPQRRINRFNKSTPFETSDFCLYKICSSGADYSMIRNGELTGSTNPRPSGRWIFVYIKFAQA
jgi:hypothetical protein